MKFCRINLSKTNYTSMTEGHQWEYVIDRQSDTINVIYETYCRHKKFDSVMPLFPSQYTDSSVDIIGYYDNGQLVAWDMIKIHDSKNAEALQFAWDYVNPDLRLGIESLKNACAIYKQRGFEYLYLGMTAKYKQDIDGYEELGPL
jgi:hypothetical protein